VIPGDDKIVIDSRKGTNTVESVKVLATSGEEKESTWVIESINVLSSFVTARTKCHIPLSFSLPQKGVSGF